MAEGRDLPDVGDWLPKVLIAAQAVLPLAGLLVRHLNRQAAEEDQRELQAWQEALAEGDRDAVSRQLHHWLFD